MPTLDVLERDWERAIQIVKEQYPHVKVGSAEFWAIVFGVVKRMRGRKSARHLKEILSKERLYEPLTFLPYMFGGKVRGGDLWMDIPQHIAKMPPSAYPTLPLRQSALLDEIKMRVKEDLNEFVDKVVERFIEHPLGVSVKSVEPLLTGVIILYETPSLPADEEIAWKLLWIYGMCRGDIQPVSPRWGYRLATMSRAMRDLIIRRIMEHFTETVLPDPLSHVPNIASFSPKLHPFIVLSPSKLNMVSAVLPYDWVGNEGAISAWASVKKLLSNIVPATFAYVLDIVGMGKLEEMKFILPTSVDATEVLCAFTDEELPSKPEFPVFRMPENDDEFKLNIRISLRHNYTELQSFKDEIRLALSHKWI